MNTCWLRRLSNVTWVILNISIMRSGKHHMVSLEWWIDVRSWDRMWFNLFFNQSIMALSIQEGVGYLSLLPTCMWSPQRYQHWTRFHQLLKKKSSIIQSLTFKQLQQFFFCNMILFFFFFFFFFFDSSLLFFSTVEYWLSWSHFPSPPQKQLLINMKKMLYIAFSRPISNRIRPWSVWIGHRKSFLFYSIEMG